MKNQDNSQYEFKLEGTRLTVLYAGSKVGAMTIKPDELEKIKQIFRFVNFEGYATNSSVIASGLGHIGLSPGVIDKFLTFQADFLLEWFSEEEIDQFDSIIPKLPKG